MMRDWTPAFYVFEVMWHDALRKEWASLRYM